MTKDEVLQKVNDYCNEKSYTEETLTSEFKEKFSEFFAKKYPDDTAIDADGIFDDIKFNLSTAFSAASKGLTSKQKAFEAKENEYKNKIAELTKKAKKDDVVEKPIPKEVQDQLDELQKFKNEQSRHEKFKNIVQIAKQSIRKDWHKSLENYASDFKVELGVSDEEQAKKLASRFQEIFKDSIGDIKPFAPKQTQKQDEEFIESLPKIKVC